LRYIFSQKKLSINMKKVIFALLGIGLIIASCGKEDLITYDCTGLTPTYTSDVKALMDAHCATAGCHDAISKESGYDLSTYQAVVSDAEKNAFMGSMQHLKGYDSMPENSSKLSDTDLKTISCWIENGVPE